MNKDLLELSERDLYSIKNLFPKEDWEALALSLGIDPSLITAGMDPQRRSSLLCLNKLFDYMKDSDTTLNDLKTVLHLKPSWKLALDVLDGVSGGPLKDFGNKTWKLFIWGNGIYGIETDHV